ncbi:MAG: hypothetical protein P1U56_26010 [Saprospiraceae bacterium]|nr:hypothetical protein [Saprospiraceae bacterium]
MKKMILMASLFIATASLAQNTDAVQRKGFVIAVGVSKGEFHIQDNNGSMGIQTTESGISLPDLKMGFMLSSRAALLMTSIGVTYEVEEDIDHNFQLFTPTIQFWTNDKVWISGGFGLSLDAPSNTNNCDFDNPNVNVGFAYSFSTGYELVQRGKYVLDLQARLQGGGVELPNGVNRNAVFFTIGVGFNWY